MKNYLEIDNRIKLHVERKKLYYEIITISNNKKYIFIHPLIAINGIVLEELEPAAMLYIAQNIFKEHMYHKKELPIEKFKEFYNEYYSYMSNKNAVMQIADVIAEKEYKLLNKNKKMFDDKTIIDIKEALCFHNMINILFEIDNDKAILKDEKRIKYIGKTEETSPVTIEFIEYTDKDDNKHYIAGIIDEFDKYYYTSYRKVMKEYKFIRETCGEEAAIEKRLCATFLKTKDINTIKREMKYFVKQ